MKAEAVLPDHVNRVEIDGVSIRKGRSPRFSPARASGPTRRPPRMRAKRPSATCSTRCRPCACSACSMCWRFATRGFGRSSTRIEPRRGTCAAAAAAGGVVECAARATRPASLRAAAGGAARRSGGVAERRPERAARPGSIRRGQAGGEPRPRSVPTSCRASHVARRLGRAVRAPHRGSRGPIARHRCPPRHAATRRARCRSPCPGRRAQRASLPPPVGSSSGCLRVFASKSASGPHPRLDGAVHHPSRPR